MTKTMQTALAAAVCAALLAGCTPSGDLPAAPKPTASVKADSDPLQIASAGHGMIFDSKMRPIMLDAASAARKQQQLLGAVRQRLAGNADVKQLLADHALTLAQSRFGADEQFLINAALIGALASKLEGNEALKYRLQNQLLIRHIRQLRPLVISSRLQEFLNTMWSDLLRPSPSTTYMTRCRSAGVPIPPDWAETGTAWVNQGALGTNILATGRYAGVYTYHDRTVRGACVALPRDPLMPGATAAAGIICQSATTGAACFWDNISRAGGMAGTRIDWRGGGTLRIAELQDGDILSENCTACHTGNNVYLVSPDDPTWAKLLRRSMDGTDHGNFTLRVRASTDNRGTTGGSTARYVPISTQAGWRNPINPPVCFGSCHETPSISAPILMAPNCSKQPGAPDNHERCYVNPF